MEYELPDRSGILFGREPDIEYLTTRSMVCGVTAVVGRSQMGKSWVLTEFARRLSLSGQFIDNHTETLPLNDRGRYLVGFTESFGESTDHMLRAVVDLYSRWLSNSSFLEQARVVYEQNSNNLVSTAGKAFGSIFAELSRIGGPPGEAVGGIVKGALEALANANQRLVSGGIHLPRLQIEQIRELLALVQKATAGRYRIALVLDQWEKSPDTLTEAKLVDSFLRHVDDWPSCHIFLGIRSGTETHAHLKRMEKHFAGAVTLYDLPAMHLEGTPGAALLDYLRNAIPQTRNISNTDLFEMISGYPGTIYRWTSPYYEGRFDSLEKLKEISEDANDYRFAEFTELLPSLDNKQRLLGIRLALTPSCSETEAWKSLRQLVLEGIEAPNLDTLKRLGVIESISPPSFGHAKRRQAAVHWLYENCYEELREVCQALIFKLASLSRGMTTQDTLFAATLASLEPVASRVELSTEAQTLVAAALTIVKAQHVNCERLLVKPQAQTQLWERSAPLIAIGLYNALSRAREQAAFELRNKLLDELRSLGQSKPRDAVVREMLARGTYNTLIDAKEESDLNRSYTLLDELREINRSHAEIWDVRKWLAYGLISCINSAKHQGNLTLRDSLLNELRELYSDDPQAEGVAGALARSLFNVLTHAQGEGSLTRCDSLLEDLRVIARNHPEESKVNKELAKELFNALFDAQERGETESRDALLDELRSLASQNPQDGAVREWLAKGLLKTQEDSERETQMLSELTELASTHPEDATTREQLAKGLHNSLCDACKNKNFDLRNSLLEELRRLARTHPQQREIQEQLSKSIGKVISETRFGEDPKKPTALLEELRDLMEAYSNNKVIARSLATALTCMLVYSKERGELDRRDELLEEMRKLAQIHPNEEIVVMQLVVGLAKTLNEEKEKLSHEKRRALENELSELASHLPEGQFANEIREFINTSTEPES